jgi:acetate kinase
MAWLGLEVGLVHNEANDILISTEVSRVRVLVTHTNEEDECPKRE